MKTPVHSVQAVYDELAKSYDTDAHRTTKLFHGTQRLAILLACRRTAATLGKQLEEIDVLTIGVGDGQQRRDLCILPLGLSRHRVKDSRLTELDISTGMLQVAEQLHPRDIDYLAKYEDSRLPRQIQGDALTTALPANSFDVVVGALIDHIPNQPALYRKIVKVLRPNGVFVVTYPHRRLMEVIRHKIYGIPVHRTRFIIRGKTYLIPSLALLPADASRLIRQAGLVLRVCKTLRLGHGFYTEELCNQTVHPFSPTVWQAQKLMGVRPSRLPILTFAVGQKPAP